MADVKIASPSAPWLKMPDEKPGSNSTSGLVKNDEPRRINRDGPMTGWDAA
jgi:hypothetical protein